MLKRALYALIPVVVLAGCHLMRDAPPADKSVTARTGVGAPHTVLRCTQKSDCKVNVIVTACARGGIRVEPYELRVARGLTNVTITWTIRTSLTGITFAEDGISFKPEIKTLALRQFKASRPAAHGAEFEWLDQNVAPGDFPYDVKVQQNGRDCPVYDPIVVNE